MFLPDSETFNQLDEQNNNNNDDDNNNNVRASHSCYKIGPK